MGGTEDARGAPRGDRSGHGGKPNDEAEEKLTRVLGTWYGIDGRKKGDPCGKQYAEEPLPGKINRRFRLVGVCTAVGI